MLLFKYLTLLTLPKGVPRGRFFGGPPRKPLEALGQGVAKGVPRGGERGSGNTCGIKRYIHAPLSMSVYPWTPTHGYLSMDIYTWISIYECLSMDF